MSSSSSTTLVSAALGVAIGVLSCKYYYKNSDVLATVEEGEEATNKDKIMLSCIQQRRSIFPKQYTGHKVPKHIMNDILEAARWTPSHGITEPWKFVIFESSDSRKELGAFLAKQYKELTNDNPSKFSQAKYDKKLKNCQVSSCVMAILVRKTSVKKTNPIMEEISSVAMAVQNMHLMASAHNIGAYWSTGGIYEAGTRMNPAMKNPKSLTQFLKTDEEQFLCLGWFFVGDFYGAASDKSGKKWPRSRRNEICDGQNVVWK